MSGGNVCKCGEHKKPLTERNWIIISYKCNYSTFNGRHYTPSDYSSLQCMNDHCYGSWRTKANYVNEMYLAGMVGL